LNRCSTEKIWWIIFLLIGVVPISHLQAENSIPVQNGQKIGFLGDSITEQGAAPSGYVNLVIMGLKVEGVEAIAIPAGVSGNTSGNMRARLEPHVLSKGANWMTLSCGVNDVRMAKEGRGGTLDEFKKNVSDIVERALAKNVKIVLLTTTPLGEDLDGPRNTQIAPYNDFLRSYAKEKNLILADVNMAFREFLKNPPPGFSGEPDKKLLADGTHPNQEGQILMARTVLKALGVPDADFPKIEKEWMENPRGKAVKLGQNSFVLISQNQYNSLEQLAKKQHKTVRTIMTEIWDKALKESSGQAKNDPAKASEDAQKRIGPMVDEYIKSN